MKTGVDQDEQGSNEPELGTAEAGQVRQPANLAARMGRWSAQHRKAAIFGWFGFVFVAFALGTVTGTKQIDQATSGVGESGRVDRTLDAGFKQPAGETVLIESNALDVRDAAFKSAIADVVTRVSKVAAVKNVRSPLDDANRGQFSDSGHAALVDFDIRGDSDKA